jgi:hypothetical protein
LADCLGGKWLLLIIFVLCIGYEICSLSESGSARLVGFNSSYVGYVEVCREGYWTALFYSEDQWTLKNSMVACRELGFYATTRIFSQAGYAVI